MDLNPEAVKAVEKALYQARWVEAYGKNPVLATDEVLAKVAVEAIFNYLKIA